MVDFLCSKISIFDVRRIQPTVLPTPKSSKIEIGFWSHSNKNHIPFSRHVSSFSDDMVDFLCSKISSFDVRRIQPTPKSSKVEIGFWLHSNKNSFYLDLYPCLGRPHSKRVPRIGPPPAPRVRLPRTAHPPPAPHRPPRTVRPSISPLASLSPRVSLPGRRPPRASLSLSRAGRASLARPRLRRGRPPAPFSRPKF